MLVLNRQPYLPGWSRAAHTRTQYPSWSPLVVSSGWSRSSRGCSPPGLPVSVSRSPWPPRRGQPLAERGVSSGRAPGEQRGSRSACCRQTQTHRASVEPSTLTGPLHPSSVLPANPSESSQISSGGAELEEVNASRVWRGEQCGGLFSEAAVSWESVPLMCPLVRGVEKRSCRPWNKLSPPSS